MANATGEIVAELNTLLRLTQTEAAIAEVRRAQATSERIERELAQNAKRCAERAVLLTKMIRELGGVPDVIGVTLGLVGAQAKTVMEQAQSLADALLGDLALERQLFDRARFVNMLAKTAGETRVVRLMERLEEAHATTIEWIETRLGEVAIGGPVAIGPSPTQAAIGYAQKIAFLPARRSVHLMNRSIEAAGSVTNDASATVGSGADKVRSLAQAASRVWTRGRNAVLEQSEDEATRAGASRAAGAIHETRRDMGALSADELPIRNFDRLTAGPAATAVRKLDTAEDVRAVLAYEAANKNRRAVLDAGQRRIEQIVDEIAAAS